MNSDRNLNGSSISGFSALCYVNFIIKKKYRVDAIAKEMQIATDTLYRYVRGENVMPADRIVDLVRTTGDVEYLEFFCEPCGYHAVPAVKGRACQEPIEKDEIQLSVLTGEGLKAIEDALADGNLDKKEKARIAKALIRLQAKAAELKEKITAMAD